MIEGEVRAYNRKREKEKKDRNWTCRAQMNVPSPECPTAHCMSFTGAREVRRKASCMFAGKVSTGVPGCR